MVVTGETSEYEGVLSRVPQGACSCCHRCVFLSTDQPDHKKAVMVKSAGAVVLVGVLIMIRPGCCSIIF